MSEGVVSEGVMSEYRIGLNPQITLQPQMVTLGDVYSSMEGHMLRCHTGVYPDVLPYCFHEVITMGLLTVFKHWMCPNTNTCSQNTTSMH